MSTRANPSGELAYSTHTGRTPRVLRVYIAAVDNILQQRHEQRCLQSKQYQVIIPNHGRDLRSTCNVVLIMGENRAIAHGGRMDTSVSPNERVGIHAHRNIWFNEPHHQWPHHASSTRRSTDNANIAISPQKACEPCDNVQALSRPMAITN